MISTLRKFGIEPQAVEQPLDLSIPENKMMLAFYLAAPEVENDRRALNTFHGMRRAKKEGRWMGTAPVGYVNKISEDGRKHIAQKEKDAAIMQWAFNELATESLAADQVRKEANRRGLKCSRSNFWMAIRNPVYYGKILIPRYKDEEAHLVQGQHEPIISEALFYEVQDVLDGNKRKERPKTKITSHDNLPLRGYLECPKCSRMITGSASKGSSRLYFYYHCVSSCGFRHRSDKVNDLFVKELKKFVPHPAIVDLSKMIITEAYQAQFKQKQGGSKQILDEMDKVNQRLSKARELLLSDAIDAADYKLLKKECESKIARLELQLTEQAKTPSGTNIELMLEKVLSTLTRLDILYKEASVTDKRVIISSIFPEKICFDGFTYRTLRVNAIAQCIYQINNKLPKIKNRKSEDLFHLSGLVAPTGIEPISKV